METDTLLIKHFNRLVVSEDAIDRSDLSQLLPGFSYDEASIDVVGNVSEALRLIPAREFDLIFIVLKAYDHKGLDAIDAVRKANPHIAVIAILDKTDDILGQDALARGAQEYLVKGQYDARILKKAVSYAIERIAIEMALWEAHENLDVRVEGRTKELLQANSQLMSEINERKKTENKLQESEARLRSVLEVINDGITFSDATGQFYIYNPAMERLTGFSMEEANASADFSRLIYPVLSDWQRAYKGLSELMEQGRSREVESTITTKDKKEKHVLIYSILVRYRSQTMFLSVYRDITELKRSEADLKKSHEDLERKVQERTRELMILNEELKNEILSRRQAQENLQESESRYRLLAENTSDVVWLVDMDYNWIYISPSITNLLGYTPQEVVKKDLSDIFTPESCAIVLNVLEDDVRKKKDILRSRTFELECKCRDGRSVWTEIKTNVILDAKGEPYRIMGTVREITDTKKAMAKAMQSLQEKEVLLREVHHRVKNNLQIISSLLNLQSMNMDDKRVLDTFRASQGRIRSIAIMHEALYKTNELSRIDFKQYVVNLLGDLFDSYWVNRSLVSADVEINNVFFDIDTAVLCGLILNELISNVLKYAFPEGKPGHILLRCIPSDGGFVIDFSDDGVGFPQGFDHKNTPTLGLRLINSLAAQLDGAAELDGSSGVKWHITFKKDRNQR
jgi:PAS domain S-box-containing protein